MPTPVSFDLIKRTFQITVPWSWVSSPNREKFSKFLLAHGAHTVKRKGSSKHQCLYVSWLRSEQSNQELEALIQAALSLYTDDPEITKDTEQNTLTPEEKAKAL